MKYLSVVIIVGIFLITTSLILVTASDGTTLKTITNETKEYIENFIEKRGIDAGNVGNITEINLNDLPGEVTIENIDDTNLAIYEIQYNESLEQKQVFVITYSVEQLNSQGDLIIAHDKRQFLAFGYSGEITESEFLKTSTGVDGGADKGYVMMREGSITGISTNLEITETSSAPIEIIIYKNGQPVKFSNTITAQEIGTDKDFDLQSKGIVSFVPGDLISVYAKTDGTIKDVITMVEITTN